MLHARGGPLDPHCKNRRSVFVARRIITSGRNYFGAVGKAVTNTLSAMLPVYRFVAADPEAEATMVDFGSQTGQTLTKGRGYRAYRPGPAGATHDLCGR